MDNDFLLVEHDRMLSNIVRIGIVEEVDYKKARAKIRLEEELATYWLPWVARKAGTSYEFWPLEKDEQVVVLFPSGDLNQGIIIGSICKGDPDNKLLPNTGSSKEEQSSKLQSLHKVIYKDETSFSYDCNKDAHNFLIEIRDNSNKAAIEVNADPQKGISINIRGEGCLNVASEGDINLISSQTVKIKGKSLNIEVEEIVQIN